MLETIKIYLGIDDIEKDELINKLILHCKNWLTHITNIDSVDGNPDYDQAVCELVISRYNKLGSEGLAAEGMGPLNMTYEELPYAVRALISSIRRVKF